MLLRDKAYQSLYKWALKQWRKSAKNDHIKRVDPKVSIHALYRFAERIDGYDYEKASESILNQEARERIAELGGSGKFSVGDIYYVVNNGVVITVAKAEGVKKALVYHPFDGDSPRKWSF